MTDLAAKPNEQPPILPAFILIRKTQLTNFGGQLHRQFHMLDKPILFATIGLMLMGIIFSFSASPAAASRYGLSFDFYFTVKHVVFVLAGLALLTFSAFIPARFYQRYAAMAFVLILGLLLAVFLLGDSINGARRWLDFGVMKLQPSELLKPAFILLGAALFSRKFDPESPFALVWMLFAYLISVVLLLLQPDLGQTLLLTAIFIFLLFLNNSNWRLLTIFCGLGAIFLSVTAWQLPYVRRRLFSFIDPSSGDTYQTDKAAQMLKSGGWLGKGPGEGGLKYQLPDAHTDFIIAVAAEEFGLVAILIALSFFAIILLRLFDQASKLICPFARLVTSLIAVSLALQIFIHMCVTLQIIPAKGMTLPLLSYGGSSMLSICLSLGIAMAMLKGERYKQFQSPI